MYLLICIFDVLFGSVKFMTRDEIKALPLEQRRKVLSMIKKGGQAIGKDSNGNVVIFSNGQTTSITPTGGTK